MSGTNQIAREFVNAGKSTCGKYAYSLIVLDPGKIKEMLRHWLRKYCDDLKANPTSKGSRHFQADLSKALWNHHRVGPTPEDIQSHMELVESDLTITVKGVSEELGQKLGRAVQAVILILCHLVFEAETSLKSVQMCIRK
jgi:hypothetical protein